MLEQSVKVVLLGDSGVGKSSLALRFVTNEFKPYSESTIGASFMSKSIRIPVSPSSNGGDMSTEQERNIGLQIWDTAGQEKYRLVCMYWYLGLACSSLYFTNVMATYYFV